MMIKSSEEIIIYESPDGGKTVYSRKSGEAVRQLQSRLCDPEWVKEQEINKRWANLKEAVFLADTDPTLDDAIKKVEMLYLLKKSDIK
jgi:siroheme synthase (precorrin-2 oxidase/ferrochelatase)